MNRAALEVRNLDKAFGSVHAVNDVSFTVPKGKIVALMGENGAGKSTAAAIAAGLLVADAGTVLVDGVELTVSSPRSAYDAGVRVVPQEVVLCKNLTVADNVCLGHFPRTALGLLNARKMRKVAADRLKRLGLDHLDVNRQVAELTVAECAFVQIARVLTDDAKVLIMDEPTAPMSAPEAAILLDLMGKVTARNVGILFVSHRLEEVFQVCDAAVVMRDGRVVAELDGKSMDRDEMVSLMVGGRQLEPGQASIEGRSNESGLSARHLVTETLRGVDIDVRVGEIVAVYGIAGSGREELGPALVGRLPRTGEVTVAGKQLPGGNVRAAIAAGVGYVPAERRTEALMLDSSVQRNVTVAISARLAHAGLLRSSTERAVTRRWMDTLHIAGRPESPVRTLSGGSQQKVVLARWLAADAPVLILVEPTRGVDIATKAEIYRILRQLAADGKTVLVISSDIEEVSIVGDRVIVLRHGRVVAELPASSEETIARHALTSTDTATPDTERRTSA
jgi:ABC-type sugar transport system ATPase subunit